MRKQFSKMLCVPCDRFLTRSCCETIEQGKQRGSIMRADEPGCSRIVTGWINGLIWNNTGHRKLVAPLEQKNIDEVGCAPALQFPKSFCLTLVMRGAPAGWVRRLVRGLQFNKSTCRSTSADQRDIWSANPWIDELWNYGESGTHRHFGQSAFEQFLKGRCKSRFLNRSMRTPQVANSLRIAQQVVMNRHC